MPSKSIRQRCSPAYQVGVQDESLESASPENSASAFSCKRSLKLLLKLSYLGMLQNSNRYYLVLTNFVTDLPTRLPVKLASPSHLSVASATLV
jgi:hypothetical protein